MKAKFNANKTIQPVFQAISDAIGKLTQEQAKECLEDLHGNIESQIEAIDAEIEDGIENEDAE